MSRMLDLTGMRFGRLLVLERDGWRGGLVSWKCQCDCGNIHTVTTNKLRQGKILSCGCYQKARRVTHGRSKTPEYNAWSGMRARCENEKSTDYHLYGGRGIKVCDRWLRFENFFEDMGERPGADFSIDRINGDGNYEPGNCKWSTKAEQARNIRLYIKNKTGTAGVRKLKDGKFVARIAVNGSTVNLGTYLDINDAIDARKKAENKYWGKP